MSNAELANLSTFRDFTETEWEQLMALSETIEFAKGEKVLAQGHMERNLWFILEGTCQITRRTESGCQVNLAELGPMTQFGDMTFFDGATHSADVIALTNMRLLRLSREGFDKLVADASPVALKLVLNCARDLAERLRRTDAWITDLVCQDDHQPTLSEWSAFRDLVFRGA